MYLIPSDITVQHFPYQPDLIAQLVITGTFAVFNADSQCPRSQIAVYGPNGLAALVNQPVHPAFTDTVVVVYNEDFSVWHLD
jgi:hypothetical protein